jgi:hypothetical protein
MATDVKLACLYIAIFIATFDPTVSSSSLLLQSVGNYDRADAFLVPVDCRGLSVDQCGIGCLCFLYFHR